MQQWIKAPARPMCQSLVTVAIAPLAILLSCQVPATPQADQEIKRLLDFVEHSSCRFVRNGTEYTGPQARAHLEQKLHYLESQNRVKTAEDFIDLAATRSSISGRAYEVRCPEGVEPANSWLNKELQRQRKSR
ncbi:DUF5329 domain-containing protein [Pseudomonas sp. KnCO4]|uniref:DUF5329 domain-containing protein n=1 Tax=Pseudomonas sp. KnCO4 TaxID=3381355 RepID=UPI003877F574